MRETTEQGQTGGATLIPHSVNRSALNPSGKAITMSQKNTPQSPLSVDEGARQYALLSVDSTRTTDHALALVAFRSGGSDAAFAAAASIASATHGEDHLKSAFVPTDATPTWEEHLTHAAGRKPYAVSPSGIRNLRNAVRILNAAGIPTTDALAFADAKRAAQTRTGNGAAEKYGTSLSVETDPAATLRSNVSSKSVREGGNAEKRAAADAEKRAIRAGDPIGYALDTLRRSVGEDADALDAFADRVAAFAAECHAIASERRNAPAVVDARTGVAISA